MKKFEIPEIQVMELDVADVITTSEFEECTRDSGCEWEL